MSRKGGFVCICRGCSSRTGEGLFTLPRDQLRSAMWLRASNREDLLDQNIEDLHKNYRLCERHFEEKYISKGTLRKTLFPEAVPTIFDHPLKRYSSKDSSETPLEKVVVLPGVTNATPVQGSGEILAGDPHCTSLETSAETLSSYSRCTSPVAGPSGIESHGNRGSPLLSPSVSTQTSANLSSSSPRKKKLRMKLKALKKINPKKAIQESKGKPCLQDFYKLCDEYLTEPLASVVKAQAVLRERGPSGRRYSMDHKQFALTLYFLSPRAYNFVSKLLYLPNKRSLQRITSLGKTVFFVKVS